MELSISSKLLTTVVKDLSFYVSENPHKMLQLLNAIFSDVIKEKNG